MHVTVYACTFDHQMDAFVKLRISQIMQRCVQGRKFDYRKFTLSHLTLNFFRNFAIFFCYALHANFRACVQNFRPDNADLSPFMCAIYYVSTFISTFLRIISITNESHIYAHIHSRATKLPI